MPFDFMQADYDNVPPLVTLGEGEERILEIFSANGIEAEFNRVNVGMRILDEPNAAPVYETVWFPNAGDDQNQRDATLRKCNRFFTAFGIVDDERMDEGTWVGKSCLTILKLTAATAEYPEKNEVKTFVTPK